MTPIIPSEQIGIPIPTGRGGSKIYPKFQELSIGGSVFFPDPVNPNTIRCRVNEIQHRFKEIRFTVRKRSAQDEAFDGLPQLSGVRVWRVK